MKLKGKKVLEIYVVVPPFQTRHLVTNIMLIGEWSLSDVPKKTLMAEVIV